MGLHALAKRCFCVTTSAAGGNSFQYERTLGAIHLGRPNGGGRGSGSGGCVWTGGGGQAPRGHPHRKLKLKSTDVILSSSHANKLASFFTRISSLDGIKIGNLSPI